jgi:hypothetical protein
MKEISARKVTPALRPEDKDLPLLPWIDPEIFNPGYLMRGMHLLPKRGNKSAWQHTQDYWTEKEQLPAADLDDRLFLYARARRRWRNGSPFRKPAAVLPPLSFAIMEQAAGTCQASCVRTHRPRRP